MNASVIIPTHNREKVLSYVLQYYCSQDYSEEDFELIVVDDGSTDGTLALFNCMEELDVDCSQPVLKKYSSRILRAVRGWYRPDMKNGLFFQMEAVDVKFIQIKKSGRSIARNIGISFSSYPLIIFADDDIFVEPGFVKKHIQSHSLNDRTVVMGRVIHTQNLENPFAARWKPGDINTAFLSTGNASVLKHHIFQAGLFDGNYTAYGWEDFDLGIHLKENGLRSIKRGIYGYHYDPGQKFLDTEKTYHKEKERGFSAVYFYKTHPLRWVKRFTLVNNRLIQGVFQLFGFRNWFLSKKKIFFLKGLLRLIIRYKGYFDGILEGKDYYKRNNKM